MTKLELFLKGWVEVEIRSAAPEACLNRCSRAGIPFWDAEKLGSLGLRLRLFYRNLYRFQCEARHAQAEILCIREHPGVWRLAALLRRPFLWAPVIAAVCLTLLLQNHIWYVTVSGNETVSTQEILQAASALGVHFGTKNSSISSQTVKNHLLNEVEGLQWAAVNCDGGRCELLVKERESAPELLDRRLPCDVVAAQDGTIVALSVLEGQALCTVGDTVREGQLLVSGINDFTVHVQKTHAQAEIYARTWRKFAAVTPENCTVRCGNAGTSVCRYLQLGSFRIKISGSSSIYTPGCDKIIKRNVLTLPGGIVFPIALIEERCSAAPVEAMRLLGKDAESLLLAYGGRRIPAAMTAGEILGIQSSLRESAGSFCLQATYACQEMIARERDANIFGSEQDYGGESSERRTN